jgi:uncharacterized protein (TIGR02266 family)
VTRPKILLVDDVNLIIQLEKNYLKHLPVDILVARNGEEALAIAREQLPDLIFMDLNMPVMDGTACCSALKKDPDLSAIPVVMVTTAGKPEDEALCRSAGCDDYVTKPIDNQLFLEKARLHLVDFERRHRRVQCRSEVSVLQDGVSSSAVTSDISVGGVFIATDSPLPEATPVEISLEMPGEELSTITAKGRVVWENSEDNPRKSHYPTGYGVEFTDIDPDVLSFIQAFVDGTKINL